MNKLLAATALLVPSMSDTALTLNPNFKGGTNMKRSKPFGRHHRHPVSGPQQLTNPKYMSRLQRAAHSRGEEIWV